MNQEKEELLKFIDDKINLYSEFRKILYDLIDDVHYSPQNIEIFKLLPEIFVRHDELYQLKQRLTGK